MFSGGQRSMRITVAVAGLVLVAGCATSDATIKMEPHSVAKRLGVPHCQVSIPLSQTEVLEEARRWGDPIGEFRPEWAKIVAELKPGDQLRMIDCVRVDHNFYFAHIRNDTILTKMYTMILD
jgi:hypothetical protein